MQNSDLTVPGFLMNAPQFMLEGLRDAQEELQAQGIELLVHLPEPPSCDEEERQQTTIEELHSQVMMMAGELRKLCGTLLRVA